MKSYFYSLGKIGFLSNASEKFLLDRIQGNYLINLLNCACNLNFYDWYRDLTVKMLETFFNQLQFEYDDE